MDTKPARARRWIISAAVALSLACWPALSGCANEDAPAPPSSLRATPEPFYVYYDRDNGDAVSELQNELFALDFYAGEITGFYDELTAEAVALFQESVGLPVTGKADDNTLEKLFDRKGN